MAVSEKEVLQTLRTAHPLVGRVLQHRELTKLKGTWIDGLLARTTRTGDATAVFFARELSLSID
jgi:DNA polymerase I-like protein with 3'-5' exonuclease and polymerase domains